MFEVFENRAILSYRVVTISDLHIGSHGSTAPAEVDSPVIKNADGFPIVPGSSLKGVLRTEFERLLRGLSCDVCTIPDVCGGKKRKKEKGNDEPCLVCQLFGGMTLAGSIRIRDATAGSRRTYIRDGVAIDRKTRKAKTGAKYDMEVVPGGTILNGQIIIENLTMEGTSLARLGAFLSLVEFYNACSGRLGHATSRGFGKVRIEIESIQIISAQDYLKGQVEGITYLVETEPYAAIRQEAADGWTRVIGQICRVS